MDYLSALQDVFRDVFEADDLTLTRETTAKDVEGWDSVQHVTLILEVESKFRVRFSTAEMAYMKNVGDLMDLLEKKRA